ncbi:MAG: hypothetical protein AB7Q17_17950 [Phycisphaerae bacterium]
MKRTGWWVSTFCVSAAVAAVLIARAGSASSPDDQSAAPRAVPAAASSAVEWRGLAIQVHTGFGVLDLFRPRLREIADLGANCVLISTAGYMEHARAQAIYIDGRKTPSPAEFNALLAECRKLGLRPILMPIVLLSHPRGSEWRGVIEPPDWKEWWEQYREFIVHFADIARDGGVEGLIIGSELVSTEKYTAEWIKVIAAAREHFPAGKLGYSANWDHYKPIQFWDKLDFVGMNSYYTLADKDSPSVDDVVAKWRPIHKQIFEWQRQVRKPIVMTEVGWCSQVGIARNPWNYYQNQKASPEGHEEQRRLYEAFLRVFNGTPGLMGVVWWEWQGDGGPTCHGYTPRGKPAEDVLRRWFAEGRKTAADAAAAAASSAPPTP